MIVEQLCSAKLSSTKHIHGHPSGRLRSYGTVPSITSTNRGSQLIGAAVGDLLLGPMGLLVGGVTGSKRTVQRVSQIAVKVIVDDRASPIHLIEFLRVPGAGADPRNKEVKAAAQRAEHIHAVLFNAMRNVSDQTATPVPQLGPSTTDQIEQLWKLKESGALTQGEFDAQKAFLLRA